MNQSIEEYQKRHNKIFQLIELESRLITASDNSCFSVYKNNEILMYNKNFECINCISLYNERIIIKGLLRTDTFLVNLESINCYLNNNSIHDGIIDRVAFNIYNKDEILFYEIPLKNNSRDVINYHLSLSNGY